MNYKIFLPDQSLIKTAQWTIQALAWIAAIALIAVAGTLALHAVAWLCSELIVFIHAFSEVCRAAYDAIGGTPVSVVGTLIIWALLLVTIKLACVLFPQVICFFGVQGDRV